MSTRDPRLGNVSSSNRLTTMHGQGGVGDELLALEDRALAFTSCGVTIADATAEDLPLIYANPSFCELTGYPVEEILGRNCRFLQGEDHEQPALEEVRSALAKSCHCRVVLRNYRKDGSMFWNELTLSPIRGSQGRPTHFVGIQTDVSDRVRLMQDLEEANRELDEFAHVVSHDLRAPLRGIRTLCSMLAESHLSELDQEAHRLSRLLTQRASRLDALVQGVLRHAKLGRAELRIEEVDVLELVSEVIDLLDVPESVHCDVADDLPVISCDRVHLMQIFQNLISNAVVHRLRPAGQLAVEWDELEDHWRFRVVDDGPGIPPEHHRRIFGLFHTLRSPHCSQGAGVGLSIVKSSVEKLGGTIHVESAPGRGSSFIFEIPKEPEAFLNRKDVAPGCNPPGFAAYDR